MMRERLSFALGIVLCGAGFTGADEGILEALGRVCMDDDKERDAGVAVLASKLSWVVPIRL